MNKKSYYISKDKKKNEVVYFEYDKIDGYEVRPKVREKDGIEVNKIVFVNPSFSEKIIRRKIDNKINFLLKELKLYEDVDEGSEEGIRRSLLDAEKLRVQIINSYVKYLGNTYSGLTMQKIQLIISELRYKLYLIDELKRDRYMEEQMESRRGGR